MRGAFTNPCPRNLAPTSWNRLPVCDIMYYVMVYYRCDIKIAELPLTATFYVKGRGAQSPPIICKAPTANRQRRWEVIRHADRQPPWTASLPVAKKRSYLIKCTLSITQEVVYPKKNTLAFWLCRSIWWPSSRCTNFIPHSSRLQLRSKWKIEINSDSGL